MTTGTPTETTAQDTTRTDELGQGDRTVAPPRRRLPRFDLSATQLVATALAAITATFLASYLGVSGTIIGAAVASVATAVGNAVYGQSLRSTRDRVRVVVPSAARFGPRADPGSPTVVEDGPPTLPVRSAPAPVATWRRAALVAVGVFAAVLAIVTSIEVLAGRPVTDLIRGEAGSGTTLFGGTTATNGTDAPAPTITKTVTPSIVITTPTITQTAPAVTRTTTPTTSGSAPAPSTDSSPSGLPTTPKPAPTGTP